MSVGMAVAAPQNISRSAEALTSLARMCATGWGCGFPEWTAAGRQATAVLDALPQPVIVTDTSGRIARINERAEQAFGYARSEAIGQALAHLLPADSAGQALLGRRKDSSTFPVAVSRQSLQVDGTCLEVHLVRDVADEQDRLRQQEEFFANASHELRSPAATIRASAELLLDVLPPHISSTWQWLLTNIGHDAERLSCLIDDLLDLNSIRDGRVRVRAAPSDLREVAERAVRAMEPIAYRQGQALTLMLPSHPVGAVVDEELLGRALLNLVSNACKYGRQEGGRVDVLLEADGHEGVFTVSDDGPGITEADLERIFQRFYRAPTPEGRRVQGNGLGLPLCRMLVELHGGRVWVDRGPGVGSVFRLAVPLNSLLSHCSSAR